MDKTQEFLKRIENNDISMYSCIVFSVFNRWLTLLEARRTVMCYQQAVEEDKIDIFEKYKTIYFNAFDALYQTYKENLLVHFCIPKNETEKSDFNILDNSNIIQMYDNEDCFKGLYKPLNISEYNRLVLNNLHEHPPLSKHCFQQC